MTICDDLTTKKNTVFEQHSIFGGFSSANFGIFHARYFGDTKNHFLSEQIPTRIRMFWIVLVWAGEGVKILYLWKKQRINFFENECGICFTFLNSFTSFSNSLIILKQISMYIMQSNLLSRQPPLAPCFWGSKIPVSNF